LRDGDLYKHTMKSIHPKLTENSTAHIPTSSDEQRNASQYRTKKCWWLWALNDLTDVSCSVAS